MGPVGLDGLEQYSSSSGISKDRPKPEKPKPENPEHERFNHVLIGIGIQGLCY